MQKQENQSSHGRSFLHNLPHRDTDIPQTYAWFAEMRQQYPVLHDSGDQAIPWQVFRYADVEEVLTNYTLFSSYVPELEGTITGDTLVVKDPPDHRKLRNLVNLAFTPRAVARLSDRIAEVTQELLDQVRAQGKMDVVTDLSIPLPARIVAEMLGVPNTDWEMFRQWITPDHAPGKDESVIPMMQQDLYDYVLRMLNERRRSPREDLITALSEAEVDGERLSERELVSFCIVLLAAGQDTTRSLLANAIFCLTNNPQQLEQLQRDSSLLPTAIEEVLRYLPPVWFLLRRTTKDVDLAGQHIPAKQVVLAWIASANRDAAQFSDPENFDIRRKGQHLAFGHGIHFCLGAPLARLEAKVVLPIMLEQLRDLQRVPDVPLEVVARINFVFNNLPVTFRAY
jgi:cytochrome P450